MSASSDGYTMQLGAFRRPETASTLLALLRERGYEPRLASGRMADGSEMHFVRLAEYSTWTAAKRAADEFTAKERLSVYVTSLARYR